MSLDYQSHRHQTERFAVVKVPLSRMDRVWHHAAPFILVGMTVAPELRIDDIVDGLADESIQLWLVLDKMEIIGAFLTSIERDKGDWVVSLYALGGSGAKGWLATCDRMMETFAKHEGAARVRMCGRKAWTRLLPKDFAVTGERGGHNIYERAVQ